MALIEIFRAGRHLTHQGESIAFGETELEQIVSSYDPAVHEAPLVVGHPSHDSPAYGWVERLTAAGGSLEAAPRQVDPQFAEWVGAGLYKKISASFYRPESPANPKPGSWYLRHVGFLGGQPPAVKGLREVSLAEGEKPGDFVELAEVDAPALLTSLRALLVEQLGEEEVVKAFAAAAEEAEEEEPEGGQPPAQDPEMAERARRRSAELDQRERRLQERERAARRRSNESFLEATVAKGRPLPCRSSTLLAFMELLEEAEGGSVFFGEAETRSPVQIFRDDVIGRLPKQVELSEVSGAGEGETSTGAESVAKAAVAYQEEQRAKGVLVSTTDAVRHVRKKGQ